MEEKRLMPKMSHNVIVEGRKKLSVSAVEEVGAFDEKSVTLKTSMGVLIVKGDKLHVNRLSIETGDVDIEGVINSCSYTEASDKTPKGFFGRLF